MGHRNDARGRNWRELRRRSITRSMPLVARSLSLALLAALALPANAMAADAIIVKRAPGLDRAERLAVRADAEVKLSDMLTLPDTEVVVPRDGDVGEALQELNANPDVVYAEPDTLVRLQSNDSRFGELYGLQNTGQTIWDVGVADADIDAPEAWLRTRGAGAVVAVVDTGFELTHPDLAGQFTGNPGERGAGKETNGIDDDANGKVDDWLGWDFLNDDNTVEDEGNFHGTHVAGTIAALADNGIGIAGVAPEAKVVPLKIFGGPGSQAPVSRIVQAFDYAGDLGVPVVNASLGGIGTSSTITNAIAAHPNTLYVVSAGNDNADAGFYLPCNAAAANVVCVGATDNRDLPADFSNFSRDRGRPVRAGRVGPLDDALQRLHVRQRDLDGCAARVRRSGAPRRGRAGEHDTPIAGPPCCPRSMSAARSPGSR